MPDEHALLRAEWLDLIRRRLPEAARARADWPVRLDHCFARVILDAVHNRPWREAIAAPAWRSMREPELRAAIALARAILTGEADLNGLNVRSLALRGKPQKVRQSATIGPRSNGTLRPT